MYAFQTRRYLFPNLNKLSFAVTLALTVTGLSLAWSAGKDLANGDAVSGIPKSVASAILLSIAGNNIGGSAGAVVGLGISLVAQILSFAVQANANAEAEHAANKQKFLDATGLGDIKATSQGNYEWAMDLLVKFKSIDIENPLGDSSANFTAARDLIDQIFTLDGKENKTADEIATMISLIKDLNALNIDGLQLEYDDLTRGVNMTRDAVQEVIDKQEELAMSTALRDLKTELMKEKIKIEVELAGEEGALKKAQTTKSGLQTQITEVEQHLKNATNDYTNYINEMVGKGFSETTIMATEQYKLLESNMLTYQDQYNLLMDQMNATDDVINTTKSAINKLRDASDEAGKKIGVINSKLVEMTKKTYSVTIGVNYVEDQKLGVKGLMSEVSAKAAGGYVPNGQMFIAREAGAELVGSIGGRTAVANNDQIVEAVSEGVYAAMSAAMSNGNQQSQPVLVYLDGKQIYASVQNTKKEKGATIGTGGLIYG